MDFLQDLKIFSVPRWVKVTVIVLLAALGAINTAVFVVGMTNDSHREGWIKASIDLLGVLLPIFLIVLVALQANTGTDALRRVTEDFFLSLLPDILGRIGEVDGVFFEARAGRKLLEHPKKARILTNLRRGDCYADMVLFLPHDDTTFVEILIRIELNVHKINLNICFDMDLFEKRQDAERGNDANAHLSSRSNNKPAEEWLHDVFAHTMRGAAHPGGTKNQGGDRQKKEERETGRLVYDFNDLMIKRTVCNRSVTCLVAAIDLPGDFLWDASERLFFAQNLMFFIRSCLIEGNDMFRSFSHLEVELEIARLQNTKHHG